MAASALYWVRWCAEDGANLGAHRVANGDGGGATERRPGDHNDDAGDSNRSETSGKVVHDTGVVPAAGSAVPEVAILSYTTWVEAIA